MRGRRLGFYLSHRVVLTVPKPGVIRAASLKDFQPAQVFAVDGVALPFYEAMTAAAECQEVFPSSFDIVKKMLHSPAEPRLNDFRKLMKQHYGAEWVDFTVPVPQNDNSQSGKKQWKNQM